MSVRIALLICGGLTGKALEANGDYLDVYTRYLKGTVPTRVDFTLDPFFVAKEHIYPNEENYDCIMLTGSAASAYDDIEWINSLAAYIARVAANKNARSKIIGICFGHQIVARALGGQCVPNNGIWEVGPTAVRLTALGQKIFGEGSEDLVSVILFMLFFGWP
jgi:GMP synthase-like glutamine amidotransferase